MEKAQKSSLLRGICYILIPILVLMMLISVADEILKSEYGEFKTKIEGYRFEFEDENYIKIYSSSGCFQIYDLNGNNIVYEVYNKYEVNSNDLTCTKQIPINTNKVVSSATPV